ncbi:MAG: hypothetical protein JXR26_12025 [Balneolaceae bacterium]|nr:hypothetical protein [Balneolaceae bacterium]
MDEHTKKQLIAILLFVSCLFSGWLLFITPAGENKQLHSFAQADSLLNQTFGDFNISSNQISSRSIRVDSTFSRKSYRISVPPEFSKTQFHAALQQQLSPYDISLPAEVTFPEKDMAIHFYYGDKVFQTVKLITNKDLTMQRSFAHVIIAFNSRPPDYLVDIITSMGEPIPLAIIIHPPLVLPGWWGDFRSKHNQTLYIWPKTSDSENLLTANSESLNNNLEPLEESSPNAVLLHFFEDQQTASALLQNTPFSYIDAREAFILDADAGRSAFDQTFRALVRRAREGTTPLGIIMASEESLAWTQEELNTFKKGGLMITSPRPEDY